MVTRALLVIQVVKLNYYANQIISSIVTILESNSSKCCCDDLYRAHPSCVHIGIGDFENDFSTYVTHDTNFCFIVALYLISTST